MRPGPDLPVDTSAIEKIVISLGRHCSCFFRALYKICVRKRELPRPLAFNWSAAIFKSSLMQRFTTSHSGAGARHLLNFFFGVSLFYEIAIKLHQYYFHNFSTTQFAVNAFGYNKRRVSKREYRGEGKRQQG